MRNVGNQDDRSASGGNRAGKRPALKGVSVSYQKKTPFSFLSKRSEKRYRVIRLDRSEIEFRAMEALKAGLKLDMTVKFSGLGRSAKLTAEVVESKSETRIGTQAYNQRGRAKVLGLSPEAWEILKKLDVVGGA